MTTTETQPIAPPVVPPARGNKALLASARFASKYGTIVALIAIIAIFALTRGSIFLTRGNFIDILSDAAIISIIAGGLTIPLITNEFDLSIGNVGSFAGVLVAGFLVKQHLALPLAMLATVVLCGIIGLVNGLIVTKARVNSFVATLGVGTIVVGLVFLYNSGLPVSNGIPASFTKINLTRWLTVPVPVYIAVVILIVLWFIVNRTVFGFHAQAVGQNAEAAKLAGLNVDRVRVLSMVICSICAGIGGILLATKLGSGQPGSADGYLLSAFAAAFLGSVALRDGEFHIVGTVIGVLTVGIAFNGLAIIGAPTYWQYIVQGGLLIGAVALSTIARRVVAAR
jgi:ribose transport system permease protein